MRDRLIAVAVAALLAWASLTAHQHGPAPGTLDFSDTNYPEAK